MRVRRSPHLVLYWSYGRLVVRNYATSAVAEATPFICRLLDCCPEWTTVDDIRAALGVGPSPLLLQLIQRLRARSFLQQADKPLDARERAMAALDQWNPEAGFFHTATKHVRYWSPQESARRWRMRADDPMPSPVKSYRGASQNQAATCRRRGICDPCPGTTDVASLLAGANCRERAGFPARIERRGAEMGACGPTGTYP